MKFRLRDALMMVALMFIARPVFAHPLDVAYMDFGAPVIDGPPSMEHLTLVVAIHPYQAFELVRGGSKERFDLKQLQARGDLISAYVQDHVWVKRNGNACTWHATDAHTPDTELDAVADGVTIAGTLDCPGTGTLLDVGSTLFLEGFPQQTNTLRLETPDGYAERVTLDQTHLSSSLDLTPILPGGKWAFVATSTQAVADTQPRRTGDAAIIEIANRLLDPGLGWWGFFGLLIAAAVVGMLHALGPGHGKSLLAATLVGHKATIGRAVTLASVMAATHVADVFIMAILATFIAAILPPTTLLNYLTMASAAGLAVLGLFSLIRAIRRYRDVRRNPSLARLDDDAHAKMHAMGVGHGHGGPQDTGTSGHQGLILANASYDETPVSWRPGVPSDPAQLIRSMTLDLPRTADPHPADHHPDTFRQSLWTGFLGSLAPCPTAWAMFMATLSIGRLGAGIVLLVAFSLGLYATVVVIGLLLVVSKKFALKRTPIRLTYALPIVSAAVITGLGTFLLLPYLLH